MKARRERRFTGYRIAKALTAAYPALVVFALVLLALAVSYGDTLAGINP